MKSLEEKRRLRRLAAAEYESEPRKPMFTREMWIAKARQRQARELESATILALAPLADPSVLRALVAPRIITGASFPNGVRRR